MDGDVVKEDCMKIPSRLQALREVLTTQFQRLENPASGKKNIPAKSGADDASKALTLRSVKILRANPPVFKSGDLGKEEISVTLLSHWSGKTKQDIQMFCSKLEKVNGSAVLAIRKLLGSGKQLYSCQVPGVLIATDQNVFSDFPEKISRLLDKVIGENPTLCQKLLSSDGLMKTPILIAKGKADVLSTDALEHVSPSISFYPYVDVQNTSGRALLTLYINGQKTSESALVNGLKEGLSKAAQYADENLPDASRAMIQKYLR